MKDFLYNEDKYIWRNYVFFMSWGTFWRHDVFFWRYDVFFVLAYVWRYD